jgi:hypothetical protein
MCNETQTTPPDSWAIVELMGHVRLAGKLTEEEHFGGKLGRIDIPDGEGFITQFFGAGSVYRITLVTEAVARQVSRQTAPAPVSPWDFPKQIATPTPLYDPDYQPDADDAE